MGENCLSPWAVSLEYNIDLILLVLDFLPFVRTRNGIGCEGEAIQRE